MILSALAWTRPRVFFNCMASMARSGRCCAGGSSAGQMIEFFRKLPATLVGIEAGGASHHWARQLKAVDHAVVLVPPQHCQPYAGRNRNDAADAEAICEAMSRPEGHKRLVAVKSANEQAALLRAGLRDQRVAQRTRLLGPHVAETILAAAMRKRGNRPDI